MSTKALRMIATTAAIGIIPLYAAGCAVCEGKTKTTMTVSSEPCASPCKSPCTKGCNKTTVTQSAEPVRTATLAASTDLPPNAKPGECYAKVFYPPKFETVTERICVRPATEAIEVIPAQYEWKEKRVEIRPAETKLEIVPAQFEWKEQQVLVDPGHTGWERDTAQCANLDNGARREVMCLVSQPPVYNTVKTQCLVSAAQVREVTIPAEYETVREQVIVKAAQTRKVSVPAEEQIVEKTVRVADGGLRWELVLCERRASGDTVNKIEEALASAGYDPGAPDGELGREDWVAIETFQSENGLGIGALTYATLDKLGVDADNE